ncbi:MAG: DUF1097 family protein [Oscillospiraceae bacterium]|nr:DUF1097 family protein [Oscillospiraceae bacterium]
MNAQQKIGLCIGIGGGITAFVLCTLASYTPLIQFLWVGFMSMIIYFATGADKSFSMAGKMICSFVCGLLWGQLSNLIYVFIFPTNHWLASVLDYAVLIFLLLWIHLGFLQKTVFGFVPTVFLGLATTIGFWGRPFPYEGQGYMGEMSTLAGMGMLLALCVFGIVFSLLIQYIAGFLIPRLLKQKQQTPAEK